MKILFYGGCHAIIMRHRFNEFVRQPIEADCLVNFQLIASGRPFPYEELTRYDCIVFSPIENKGEYNTDGLVEYCLRAGIQTVSYPWLEWHGYCPTATKGDFLGHVQWFYPDLLRRSAEFGIFSDFVESVIDAFPDDRAIDDIKEKSSAHLAAMEERNKTDVRISPFIRNEFRKSRLFLISDHPSTTLYLRVMAELANAMDVDFDEERGNVEDYAQQWQWEERTPIFPRVKERLGLQFDDPTWRSNSKFPGATLSLEKYLRLYFHYAGEIATSRNATFLMPRASAAHAQPVDAGVRFVVDRVAMSEARGLQCVKIIANLEGEIIEPAGDHEFFINAEDWDFQRIRT